MDLLRKVKKLKEWDKIFANNVCYGTPAECTKKSYNSIIKTQITQLKMGKGLE